MVSLTHDTTDLILLTEVTCSHCGGNVIDNFDDTFTCIECERKLEYWEVN